MLVSFNARNSSSQQRTLTPMSVGLWCKNSSSPTYSLQWQIPEQHMETNQGRHRMAKIPHEPRMCSLLVSEFHCQLVVISCLIFTCQEDLSVNQRKEEYHHYCKQPNSKFKALIRILHRNMDSKGQIPSSTNNSQLCLKITENESEQS